MSGKSLGMERAVIESHPELVAALRAEGFAVSERSPSQRGLQVRQKKEGLQVCDGRRRVLLEPGSSLESVVFWANEFYYERKRSAGPRCPCNLPVELIFDDGCLHASTTDISDNGLFVATGQRREVGSLLTVVLRPQPGAAAIRSLGRVVHVVQADGRELRGEHGVRRVGHPGLAIELLAPTPKVRAAMRALVQRCQEQVKDRPHNQAAVTLVSV